MVDIRHETDEAVEENSHIQRAGRDASAKKKAKLRKHQPLAKISAIQTNMTITECHEQMPPFCQGSLEEHAACSHGDGMLTTRVSFNVLAGGNQVSSMSKGPLLFVSSTWLRMEVNGTLVRLNIWLGNRFEVVVLENGFGSRSLMPWSTRHR